MRTSSWCAVLLVALAGCPGAADDAGSDELEGSSTDTASSTSDSESSGASESESESASESESETGGAPLDLLEQLQAIEGMSVEELPSEDEGVRLFDLHYLQPNDHAQPEGPWFEQHAYLRHRDATAPMVLATSGYGLFYDPAYASEPTVLLDANQLNTEQRFFGTSKPDPLDWTLLTIEQAAADHHRWVAALKPIYASRWLSTGVSKGGMTSVYHRRFYPDDVDATLAYVAPHSFSPADERYPIYLESIGEPACAQALRDLQVDALARRDALLPLLLETAMLDGYTYARYGSEARVLEAAIVELRWSFWQRSGKAHCAFIPDANASDQDIHAFLYQHVGWDAYDDAMLAYYEPYYYQAAHQLGAGAITEPHLAGMLEFPLTSWDAILPAGTTLDHDPAAMLDISAWLAGEGERLMFVYGEWDPWSGGAFDPSGAIDTHVYWVAEQDHTGAVLGALPDAEFDEALAILEGWMGLAREIGEARPLRSLVQPHPLMRGIVPR